MNPTKKPPPNAISASRVPTPGAQNNRPPAAPPRPGFPPRAIVQPKQAPAPPPVYRPQPPPKVLQTSTPSARPLHVNRPPSRPPATQPQPRPFAPHAGRPAAGNPVQAKSAFAARTDGPQRLQRLQPARGQVPAPPVRPQPSRPFARPATPTPHAPTRPGAVTVAQLYRPAGVVQRALSSGPGGSGGPPPTFNLTSTTVNTTLTSRQSTWRLRTESTFGLNGSFSVDDFVSFVNSYGSIGTRSGALDLLRELRNAGVVFPPITEPVRPGLVLSLDSSVAQQAPPHVSSSMTRRQAYGMTNPSHDHSNMVPLWEAHAHTPQPDDSTRSAVAHYMSPSRNYYISNNSGQPVTDSSGNRVMEQGHSNLVMGHNPSASTYINTTGHMQSPGTNRQHNYSPSAYGGIENAKASSASGHTEPRYASPIPGQSWEGYMDVNHPRYKQDYGSLWPNRIYKGCTCGQRNPTTATVCQACGAVL